MNAVAQIHPLHDPFAPPHAPKFEWLVGPKGVSLETADGFIADIVPSAADETFKWSLYHPGHGTTIDWALTYAMAQAAIEMRIEEMRDHG